MTLSMIVSGRPLFYLVTLALLAAGLRYRDAARAWLDRRFFREQYDARQVLLSLAGRIPYETDPNELTALVLQQVDTALHPRLAAVLVSGLEDGQLTPVAVLHGTADALSASGGLATLLKWSDEPLDVILSGYLRSPARRLPMAEQQWLQGTGVELLVPMFVAQEGEKVLSGVLALGEKRSEEPYTPEDRELLASIAAQVSLALDVARLRQRQSSKASLEDSAYLTRLGTTIHALTECPECGRCEDAVMVACPDDQTAMRLVPGLPRLVDGKYRVDRVLGRGGMGAVFRARDMRLDRDVALKVVKADLLSNPDARSRFRREAQVVAKLQHPSIVSIFDYGSLPDGGAFLVMEFVRGRDLRVALREQGRYAQEDAVRLMTGVCAAIDAAHAAGVLHRDLKPENILLPDGRADVKVLDFGIAKLVGDGNDGEQEETLTAAGMPIGTPAYMAPEQLAGATVTPSDRSVQPGCAGVRARDGRVAVRTWTAARHRSTAACAAIRRRVWLNGVWRRGSARRLSWALKADPADRPRSAGEFARALDAASDRAAVSWPGCIAAIAHDPGPTRNGRHAAVWRRVDAIWPDAMWRRGQSPRRDCTPPDYASSAFSASAIWRSSAEIACLICAMRLSCVVASSWRAMSVRASFKDSTARTCSGFLTAGRRACARATCSSSIRSWILASASISPSPASPIGSPRLLDGWHGSSHGDTCVVPGGSRPIRMRWPLTHRGKRPVRRARPQADDYTGSWLAIPARWIGLATDSPTLEFEDGPRIDTRSIGCLPASRARVVRRRLRRRDAAAGTRMACDRTRRARADPRADRQRKDARGVSLVPRSPDVRAAAGDARALPRALHLAAQSAGRRRRAQPARAARGHRNVAQRRSDVFAAPAVAVRTGDTPAPERARFQREPADILITTPESLYLLLTSNAREALRSVDTVIVDEIHALVPTKRGAHLALSLERLERAHDAAAAAHRPLGDAASARRSRALPGRGAAARAAAPPTADRVASAAAAPPIAEDAPSEIHDEFASDDAPPVWRPVTIVDAPAPKKLALTVEVPVEDMARLDDGRRDPERARRAGAGRGRRSGRPSIRGCSS